MFGARIENSRSVAGQGARCITEGMALHAPSRGWVARERSPSDGEPLNRSPTVWRHRFSEAEILDGLSLDLLELALHVALAAAGVPVIGRGQLLHVRFGIVASVGRSRKRREESERNRLTLILLEAFFDSSEAAFTAERDPVSESGRRGRRRGSGCQDPTRASPSSSHTHTQTRRKSLLGPRCELGEGRGRERASARALALKRERRLTCVDHDCFSFCPVVSVFVFVFARCFALLCVGFVWMILLPPSGRLDKLLPLFSIRRDFYSRLNG